jgi:hypothetical protein
MHAITGTSAVSAACSAHTVHMLMQAMPSLACQRNHALASYAWPGIAPEPHMHHAPAGASCRNHACCHACVGVTYIVAQAPVLPLHGLTDTSSHQTGGVGAWLVGRATGLKSQLAKGTS